MEVEEVAVVLVGLGDELQSPTGPRRGAPGGNQRPDFHRRVVFGGDEEVAEEGGGRRLAVGAGDGHAEPTSLPHQLAEERLPRHDRNPPLAGRNQLGQVRLEAKRGAHGHAVAPRGGPHRGR